MATKAAKKTGLGRSPNLKGTQNGGSEGLTVAPLQKRNKTQKEVANANSGRRKRRVPLWMQEIRAQQKSTELIIPALAFRRLVVEIMHSVGTPNGRIQAMAISCLQEAAEAFLVNLFSASNLAAMHAGRVSVMPKDMTLVKAIIKTIKSEELY
ncbi:hypothetical protein OQA88_3194 [Cercophora sp. LCS_1]